MKTNRILIITTLLFLATACYEWDNPYDANGDNSGTRPEVVTAEISSKTATTASSGGFISSDGGFPITEQGVCWSTTSNPTTSNNRTNDEIELGSWVSELTELTNNTTYFVRSYAINKAGTAYGNELSFKTLKPNQISDIDGNIYNIIIIGTQVWMVENLKTTHYNDGTVIPIETDNTAWFSLTTPAYCWYDNNIANKSYGALYNKYCVKTTNIAPKGWHVATDNEWKTLEMYLGMTQAQADATGERGSDQGTQLKSTSGWPNDNDGTNSSGFKALPTGMFDGIFSGAGQAGYWWANSAPNAWSRSLYSGQTGSARYESGAGNGSFGLSIRCIKD